MWSSIFSGPRLWAFFACQIWAHSEWALLLSSYRSCCANSESSQCLNRFGLSQSWAHAALMQVQKAPWLCKHTMDAQKCGTSARWHLETVHDQHASLRNSLYHNPDLSYLRERKQYCFVSFAIPWFGVYWHSWDFDVNWIEAHLVQELTRTE